MKIKKMLSLFSALLVLMLCFSSTYISAVDAVSTLPIDDSGNETSLSMNEIYNLIPKLEQADNIMMSIEKCNSNELAKSDLAIRTGTDYGYQDMNLRSNSEGRKLFYNTLMTCMENVWVSEEDSLAMSNVLIGTFYIMGIFVLEEYGLTFEEASAVYETFRHDNPIFYYASNVLMGFPASENETYLIITCYEEFAAASVKQAYNAQIMPYIESYSDLITGKSAYEDVKTIHDKLILSMDYAYAEDGVTPSSTGTAHSIIGAIEGSGTCDTYAKTFQLLCTYYGIENIFVTGVVNSGHSWNVVKLDDGKYYFVDCTGDDLGDTIDYKFFAVGTDTLYKTHTLNTTEDVGSDFLYVLPEISTLDYISVPQQIQGDLNDDGMFDIADVVILQKWLLAVPDTTLANWKAADLCNDSRIDVFDLCLMKRALIQQQN